MRLFICPFVIVADCNPMVSPTSAQVAFNPQDNTQLCVVGSGVFKLFRYSEGNLKQFALQKVITYSHSFHGHRSHCSSSGNISIYSFLVTLSIFVNLSYTSNCILLFSLRFLQIYLSISLLFTLVSPPI